MRKIFTSLKYVVATLVLVSMTLATSCSYDDTAIKHDLNEVKQQLKSLTERVAALEADLAAQVESLTELIEGKVVVTGVETDADGNTTITLSDGKTIKVLTPEACDCDTLQYREVDGVLEVSADGKNWVAINNVTSECVVKSVVVNEDGTVTITLANDEEFTVTVAELIEFNSTRAQLYVKSGETKDIEFTINDAVVDINVMNQPLGWKASVEAAPASEEPEVLAAGGTDYILKVTGPSTEFVKAGYADKSGFVSVHFNTAAGACKVAKVQVDLAEISLNVDKEGNITVENSLVATYMYADWWSGETMEVTEFNNYYIGVMNLLNYSGNWKEDYLNDVEMAAGFAANMEWYLANYTPAVYEYGVVEKDVLTTSVQELISAVGYGMEYEDQSFLVFVVPCDMNNDGALIYDEIITAEFKQPCANIELAEATWNNLYFDVTFMGCKEYNILPIKKSDLDLYVDNGWYESVEAYFTGSMESYVANPAYGSFGYKITTDVVESHIGLVELISYGQDYLNYMEILPQTEYYFAVLPIIEGKAAEEYVYEDLYVFTASTANIVEAETAFEYSVVEGENFSYLNLHVLLTVPETTHTCYTRWYDPTDSALEDIVTDLINNGYGKNEWDYTGYTYDLATSVDTPATTKKLGILMVDAEGNYTLAVEEFTSTAVTYNEAVVDFDVTFETTQATINVSGLEGVEFTNIRYYVISTDGSSFYQATEESLKDMAISTNYLIGTSTANPVVVTKTADYKSEFVPGKTYKVAIGVNFADGTISETVYKEITFGSATPVGPDYDLVFTTATDKGNNVYEFTNEAGDVWTLTTTAPLAAGTLSSTDWDGNNTTIMIAGAGQEYPGYIYNGTIEVSVNENVYTIVANHPDTWINGEAKTLKFTFEGEIAADGGDEPVVPSEPIVLTYAAAEATYGFGDFNLNVNNADYFVSLNFYNCSGSDENWLKEGNYPVAGYSGSIYPGSGYGYSYVDGPAGYNEIASGYVDIAEVDGKYSIYFNLNDYNGTNYVFTYFGDIEGMVVPSQGGSGNEGGGDLDNTTPLTLSNGVLGECIVASSLMYTHIDFTADNGATIGAEVRTYDNTGFTNYLIQGVYSPTFSDIANGLADGHIKAAFYNGEECGIHSANVAVVDGQYSIELVISTAEDAYTCTFLGTIEGLVVPESGGDDSGDQGGDDSGDSNVIDFVPVRLEIKNPQSADMYLYFYNEAGDYFYINYWNDSIWEGSYKGVNDLAYIFIDKSQPYTVDLVYAGNETYTFNEVTVQFYPAEGSGDTTGKTLTFKNITLPYTQIY